MRVCVCARARVCVCGVCLCVYGGGSLYTALLTAIAGCKVEPTESDSVLTCSLDKTARLTNIASGHVLCLSVSLSVSVSVSVVAVAVHVHAQVMWKHLWEKSFAMT